MLTIKTGIVSALLAYIAPHRWPSMIAHAWPHVSGASEGMRVVRLKRS